MASHSIYSGAGFQTAAITIRFGDDITPGIIPQGSLIALFPPNTKNSKYDASGVISNKDSNQKIAFTVKPTTFIITTTASKFVEHNSIHLIEYVLMGENRVSNLPHFDSTKYYKTSDTLYAHWSILDPNDDNRIYVDNVAHPGAFLYILGTVQQCTSCNGDSVVRLNIA
jgi:hypothetical protein